MKRKGVCYDVGNVMGTNWRPNFNPEQVKREPQIFRDDLHRNSVKISGSDINRVTVAARFVAEVIWNVPGGTRPQQTFL